MADKMNAYYKAGILTIIVFLLGAVFGIWLDNYRLSSIRETISQIDVNWNDARLLNVYFGMLGKNYCNLALEENLLYNDKIYKEGLEIEKAAEANRFTPELEQEERRYTLLQTQFWFNSQELKDKCNFTYNNVVHLYKQEDLTVGSDMDNKLQSSILMDLKEKCGNKIMLIPLAANLNLTIIDTITKQFNITTYPAIIVDEKTVFQGLTSLDSLEEVVHCS